MGNMKANKKSLIRWKVYIDRARMYIGYIQFLMIGLLLMESVKETNFGQLFYNNIFVSIPILFVVFIVLSLMIGRLDTLLGFREEELRNASSSNPVMRDIQANLEEIKKELKEIGKKNK